MQTEAMRLSEDGVLQQHWSTLHFHSRSGKHFISRAQQPWSPLPQRPFLGDQPKHVREQLCYPYFGAKRGTVCVPVLHIQKLGDPNRFVSADVLQILLSELNNCGPSMQQAVVMTPDFSNQLQRWFHDALQKGTGDFSPHEAVTFFEHKPATWQRLSTKAHVVMPLHSGRHFTQLLFALPSDDGAIACFGEHGTIYYIDSYAIDVENESSIPHHACDALCVWAQAMLDLADAKGWGGWHMGRGVNLRKATRKIMRGVSGLQPAQNLDCAVWVSVRHTVDPTG